MNKFLIPEKFKNLSSRLGIKARFSRLSVREQIYFINRLSFLIKADVSVLESIEIIESQSSNKEKRLIYFKVINSLKSGHTLSTSLREFVDEFSHNVIYSGETGGFLGQNLSYLSEQLERKRSLKRKIIGSLIYPFIITLATLGITVFLILYVFPKILPILLSLNIDLPITTRMVMVFSSLAQDFWIHAILMIFFFYIILLLLLKFNTNFHLFFNKMYLKIPFFGDIYKSFLLSNFCRNLGFLLKGGISIDESLKTGGKTATNSFLRSKIFDLIPDINRGRQFSDCLSEAPEVFPETLVNMVAVAEKTGDLPEMLVNLADYYEKEFNHKTKNFSQTIEPALMILAGMIVGLVSISIIAPVYEVTQSL